MQTELMFGHEVSTYVGLARTIYIQCIYAPYFNVVISLPKVPYTHLTCMALANPNDFGRQ